MNVEMCGDRQRWDAYVNSCPEASNYHRWMWREAFENTFGHDTFYLAACDASAIQGVLPMVHIRSRLFHSALVSMPFVNYGGVLASTVEARTSLLQRAEEIARELNVKHVELRHRDASSMPWPVATPKVTMEVPMPKTVDELWNKLSTGMRNKIRSARKKDISVEWAGVEAVGDFYKVFSRNMRDLGTPVHPQAWYENLCRCAPDNTRLIILRDEDEPVAAGLITSFRDSIELPCSAALRESRKKNTAILLYWSVFEWAIANGFTRVDLGRCTRGSGTWEFKRHWGPEEHPLHWYYWLRDGASMPTLRPDNPRFGVAIKVWQKLPVAVTNSLGPMIARSIP